MSNQEKIDCLLFQSQIEQRVAQYGLSIDSKDWDLFRSITAPSVSLQVLPGYGQGFPPSMSNDEWLLAIQGVASAFLATHHVITNPIVTIAGDRAECRSLLSASHFYTDANGKNAAYLMHGRYVHGFIRTGDEWLIKSLLLQIIAEVNEPPFKREMESRISKG